MTGRAIEPSANDARLLESLAGLDADAEMRTADKTRRAVLGTILSMRERQVRRRQNRGIAVVAVVVLLVLLSPALWNGFEEWVDGDGLGELSAQLALLALILFTALLAALLAGWQSAKSQQRRS